MSYNNNFNRAKHCAWQPIPMKSPSRWQIYDHLKVKVNKISNKQFLRIEDPTVDAQYTAGTSIPFQILPQMLDEVKNIRNNLQPMIDGLIENGAMRNRDWSPDLINFLEQNQFVIEENVQDQRTDDLIYRHVVFGEELESTPLTLTLSFIR